MVINHNVTSLNVLNEYRKTDISMKKSLEKLASGLKINHAGDDPAGLSISEKMKSQISGMHRAILNTQDGIHFLKTAESWVAKTTDLLARLRELAIQSANGIYSYEDRLQIQAEVNGLVDEIDRISQVAEFNTLNLLKGAFRKDSANTGYVPANPTKDVSVNAANSAIASDNANNLPGNEKLSFGSQDSNPGVAGSMDSLLNKGGGVFLHVGANMDERLRVYIENLSAFSLGLASGKTVEGTVQSSLDYITVDGANQAIGKLDKALNVVLNERSNLGAYQNRLELISEGLSSAHENLQAAESQIRDTNIAEEMTNFIKHQILFQTTSTMLVNSNLKPQVVLKLLGS